MTVETEVLVDAVEAARLLRAESGVDPHRVFILGHSLGALLAPEIAARVGNVAGLILLAPPGRPMLEVLLDQFRNRGAKPNELQMIEAEMRALPRDDPDKMVLGAPARYWLGLDRRDELLIAKQVGRPILLLRGENDQNVAVADFENWRRTLASAVPLRASTLPGLNHLFMLEPPTAAEPRVADEVIEQVASFIETTPVAP
jgi:pimeloyl-ACP methyl ester carboxylesterase